MTHEWEDLSPGTFGRRAGKPGADPMWVWADATDYRDLGLRADERAEGLWCVVERDGRFVSERHRADSAAELDAAELAMPVRPERMPAPKPTEGSFPPGELMKSDAGKVLVGIIDAGCPFAARMVRDPRGTGTRVLGLWDQDDAPAFAQGGFRPEGFGYGRAIGRSGLNALMDRARLPGGEVDEDRCYRLAGCAHLRPRMGHGAAVMSQLFAAPLRGGALQPQPGKPPTWDEAGTAAVDGADLVFVDLPRAGVQDSTSAALARYVIDGLRFILAHAAAGQRVVVVISNGTSRSTHDGESLLERALVAAVDQAGRDGVDLQIVLPAGNGNLEQRHAELRNGGSHLTLFLPPGCEMPQYVSVRWPPGMTGVALRVTPPAGPAVTVQAGEAKGLFAAQGACCGVVSPPPRGEEEAARSLLAFGPTASCDPDTPRPPGGRWRIELVTDGALPEAVQFWISRNQRNPGALPRGSQACFADWNLGLHPKAWRRYDEDDPPEWAANGIRRNGSATGLATAGAASKRIHVVGSLYAAGRGDKPSTYSAAGRRVPQWSAPGDASRALPGLSMRGNHAGEVLRMVGTSFSAPLVARALVNQAIPRSKNPPSPRVGAKRLTP